MVTKTTFCPATDAFAFDNSWSIDGRELEEIRRFLAEERAGVVRVVAGSRLVRWLVRQIERRRLISGVLREEHLTRYDLCGGMAYAALDYYRQGWVLPQGAGPDDHPTQDSAAGSALRNFIWQRLLDSMWSAPAAPPPTASGYAALGRLAGDHGQVIWKQLPALDAATSGRAGGQGNNAPASAGPAGSATRGKEHDDGARR